MKKILSILAITLFMANSDVNAQCRCSGLTFTETVHDAVTGVWLYSITYQGSGAVCFVSASANPAVYRGDLPLHMMIYPLLTSGKIKSMAIPAGCFMGSTAPGPVDGAHRGTVTVFTACSPGCCVVEPKDYLPNGDSPASGKSTCPGGCQAICFR